MPLEPTTLRIAEKLLALTCALGDAAQRADNAELKALFSERAKLLAILETADSSPEVLEVLRKVQMAEVDTQGRFHQAKTAAVRDMERGLHGKKVQGTYASRSGVRALDFNG